MQTYRRTPQSVTSASVKSAVACGAACGDAGTHNVCAHRMSQSDDFVLITISFGRETSQRPATALMHKNASHTTYPVSRARGQSRYRL